MSWYSFVILATEEAEIRRIMIWSQPRQIVCETLSWKNPSQRRAGRETQGVVPEFKIQYHKKKKKNRTYVSYFRTYAIKVVIF
jgi:predicted P-loop ATPase